MRNKEPRIHNYRFSIEKEIASCYNCPCATQLISSGTIYCKLLCREFNLHIYDPTRIKYFPDDCPMEELVY